MPLYLKYSVDAEHPLEASYSYQQEEAAGQNGLRQLDADNKKRLETYRQCIENMDRLITVRTNLQLLQEHLEKQRERADRGRGPGHQDRRLRAGDVPGRAVRRSRPADQEAVAVSQDVRGGLLERLVGLRADGRRLRQAAYEDALTQLAPQWQEIYERKALEMIRRLEQPSDAGK